MNIFQKIGTDIATVVEAPVKAAEKIKTIFEQVTVDTPLLRAVFVQLIADLDGIAGDITADVTADGINIAGDIKTFQDAAAAVNYFRQSVLPVIEQVYGQIKSDFTTPSVVVPTVQSTVTPATVAVAKPMTVASLLDASHNS